MSLKTSWFIKGRRAQSVDDYETWNEGGVVPTLNLGDNTGDTRATVLIFYGNRVDDIRIQGDVINTLQARMGTGGGNMPMVAYPIQDGREIEKSQNGLGIGDEGAPAYTITTHAIQAVAIQGNVIGRSDTAGPQGKGYSEEGEPMFTLTKTDIHAVAQPSTVRRLTPTECERLQGFPEITKSAIFSLCIDPQKNSASAEIQNLKWQRLVGSAERQGLREIALSVGNDLSSSDQQISRPAQIVVRISCGQSKVEILNQGKLVWSANVAENQSSLAPHTKTEDIARLSVGLVQIAERVTIFGGAELHRNEEKISTEATLGSYVVRPSGKEMIQPAKTVLLDSTTNPKDTTFITSSLTDLRSLEQNLATLFFYVMTAINGFIPTQTEIENTFTFQIDVVEGWTDGQTDGHRYKQMGNAVAVPVVEWIVKRLVGEE